ncbi:MAG: hypothetical protein ACREL7_13755 [Longimicrobiales bacterium]
MKARAPARSGIGRRRVSSRTVTVWLAAGLLTLAGCRRDRERPSPVENEPQASLSVRLLEPAPGVTLMAGRDAIVRVSAQDLLGENLTGVGFVARRVASGTNETIDSVALNFAATSDTINAFTLSVPDTLPTSTQLDIFGIAFGPGVQSRLSTPSSVIVAQCQPGLTGC